MQEIYSGTSILGVFGLFFLFGLFSYWIATSLSETIIEKSNQIRTRFVWFLAVVAATFGIYFLQKLVNDQYRTEVLSQYERTGDYSVSELPVEINVQRLLELERYVADQVSYCDRLASQNYCTDAYSKVIAKPLEMRELLLQRRFSYDDIETLVRPLKVLNLELSGTGTRSAFEPKYEDIVRFKYLGLVSYSQSIFEGLIRLSILFYLGFVGGYAGFLLSDIERYFRNTFEVAARGESVIATISSLSLIIAVIVILGWGIISTWRMQFLYFFG